MSPIQFQKTSDGSRRGYGCSPRHDIAGVTCAVGYESPSQVPAGTTGARSVCRRARVHPAGARLDTAL